MRCFSQLFTDFGYLSHIEVKNRFFDRIAIKKAASTLRLMGLNCG